jgi:hypothetical protein
MKKLRMLMIQWMIKTSSKLLINASIVIELTIRKKSVLISIFVSIVGRQIIIQTDVKKK